MLFDLLCLLASLCAFCQGDYKALCKEAGIEPRSQKKPVPSPATLAPSPSNQPQQPQQQFAAQSPANYAQQQQQQQQVPTALYTGASPLSSSVGARPSTAMGAGPTLTPYSLQSARGAQPSPAFQQR
jgi:hypothetical protein